VTNTKYAILTAVIFAVGAAAFFGMRTAGTDDASHSTGLGAQTVSFQGSSESGVVGTITTTSSSDNLLQIQFFKTPNGGSEESTPIVEASAPRDDTVGSFNCMLALQASLLASGDQIRAIFKAFDSTPSETFSYERTYTKP
jgi:hypothetical protein